MPRGRTVLITDASTGIGAAYADRFARRGYALVLVARDLDRLKGLASRLRTETAVQVDIVQADLTKSDDRAIVEKRLSGDPSIGVLINNPAAVTHGTFITADLNAWEKLIDLNVTAVARLTGAVIPQFLKRGEGAIINIGSVAGLAPEVQLGFYGATKAFVLAMSEALNIELGPRGIYLQAVLPAATRSEIWERSGRDVGEIPDTMGVEDLVDAALVGFDRRETVSLPSLHDAALWEAYLSARKAMVPNLGNAQPAPRYRSASNKYSGILTGQ
ncbi:SDR family NAD(P)-dependent oxidoreductase [Bradyrhizobium australafricanum]|uniref:SDR family NAD(P)-dependent oxidoreductase n=1 Tax=Bradyrhizobium australafricanum TaxID=2821406 RepID=UPI001CE38125|nr:SDR family oxidoreductase [Bradyrhizobium australafricanum]MCA6100505.1 SDR family oxidoreductase [Bradyrhizobium australafricanum]